jgi:hypothetical protein
MICFSANQLHKFSHIVAEVQPAFEFGAAVLALGR